MPHTTFMAAPNNRTDADFRMWGSRLSAALETVGLVKTPIPGQVDWATALAPTVAGGIGGVEVWRFDDTLQSTHPIYFKLEYGAGAGYAGRTRLWITIGKGVDAAGEITSVIHPRTFTGSSVTQSAQAGDSLTPATCLVSSCPGRSCVIVSLFEEGAGGSYVTLPSFIIERSRTNAGEATSDGVFFAVEIGQGSVTTIGTYAAGINYQSGTFSTMTIPVLLPYTIAGTVVSGASSLASGVIAPTFPWLIFAPGLAPWQPMSGMTYLQGDAIGGFVTVRLLGQDRRYRVVQCTLAHAGWGTSINPAGASSTTISVRGGLMMLWED